MTTTSTPAERRRASTMVEIVEAAWRLARRDGLASISMRDLAEEVGLKAPTLYSYFSGKDAIYDAMFRQGYEQLLAMGDTLEPPDPSRPRHELRAQSRSFFEFAVADPVRYQLMFQRTLPGFEPSAESYAVSVEVLSQLVESFSAIGIDDPAAVDLWTAITTGLTSQQLSNEPGGDRWARLVDRASEMFCDHLGLPADPDTRSVQP